MDGLWDKANKVSELGCRLDGVAGILELLGEHLTDNAESGTAWTCAEWLRKYGEDLEKLSEDIMAVSRTQEERTQKLEAIVAKHELKKGKTK